MFYGRPTLGGEVFGDGGVELGGMSDGKCELVPYEALLTALLPSVRAKQNGM